LLDARRVDHARRPVLDHRHVGIAHQSHRAAGFQLSTNLIYVKTST
jgi:hypothetical protein